MEIDENTSDGYHTFKELYDHRIVLFIALMKSHWNISWRSDTHADGSVWPGWFIAGMQLPTGPITYHMPVDPYWYETEDIKTYTSAPEWDGHDSAEVVRRLTRWAWSL